VRDSLVVMPRMFGKVLFAEVHPAVALGTLRVLHSFLTVVLPMKTANLYLVTRNTKATRK
jgi:hypothetical protein